MPIHLWNLWANCFILAIIKGIVWLNNLLPIATVYVVKILKHLLQFMIFTIALYLCNEWMILQYSECIWSFETCMCGLWYLLSLYICDEHTCVVRDIYYRSAPMWWTFMPYSEYIWSLPRGLISEFKLLDSINRPNTFSYLISEC